MLSWFRYEVEDVQRSLSVKQPSRETSPIRKMMCDTEACSILHKVQELYFTPTERPTAVEAGFEGFEPSIHDKMQTSLTIKKHLEQWDDPGLIYFYNSKQYKTILIKREDVKGLSSFLLKKLEQVEQAWSKNESICSFPFNILSNLTYPAIHRMLKFF